jgi:hypothetical protein
MNHMNKHSPMYKAAMIIYSFNYLRACGRSITSLICREEQDHILLDTLDSKGF